MDKFAAKPKSPLSIIEEIGEDITWEILGHYYGWYVWASHTGCENPEDDFKFSGCGETLVDAVITVVEELLAIGPEWVRTKEV